MAIRRYTWSMFQSMKFTGQLLAAVLMAVLGSGCAVLNQTVESIEAVQALRVTHHAGGTHYKTIVADDIWYQTFGSTLLIIDASSGELISSTALGQIGETGPATDMVFDGSSLHIVLEGDSLVEVDCSYLRTPKIVRKLSADQLGVSPQRLSVAGGELYVSSPNGVMRVSDGKIMLADIGDKGEMGDRDVSHVVVGTDGPIACIGRRAYRLVDGKYVGSASDLFLLPEEFGIPGGFVFSRKTTTGQLIGLMTSNIREVDTQKATIAVEGIVQNIRVFSGRLWIVGDFRISSYAIVDGALVDPLHLDIIGARDVDQIDDNYIAIAGSFGRSVYRINDSLEGPGDEFLSSHREPSNLLYAMSDGRHTMALGLGGTWLYDHENHVTFVDDPPDTQYVLTDPSRMVNTTLASAAITNDSMSVVIYIGDKEQIYKDPNQAKFYCLTAVDGDIWIGHDRGITVLEINASGTAFAKDQLRLEGPVRYIFPKLKGGEVTYVSEFGGFGTIEYMAEAIALSK